MGLIQCFLKLALSSIGCRPAARALKLLAPLLPNAEFPSANGGQFWLLRMGLYELRRSRELADDWIWLIDHTIQTGHGKMFVVFAFRMSHWKRKVAEARAKDPDASVALGHGDISVWMIERIDTSNGVVVCEQLTRLSIETAIVPRAILCDQGADVRNGGEMFCEPADRPTVLLHDISHAVANALKRQLAACPQWKLFMDEANSCKTKIRQTPLAFLMPPELKNKARWMNLEPLIDWSNRVLKFLDNPHEGLKKAEVKVTAETVDEKMGWLRQHVESIAQWTLMMEAASTILMFIRMNGYHEAAPEELETLLSKFTHGPPLRMIAEVLNFVRVQSSRAGTESLPGSTEVLESLIGKGKQLTGSTKNGYTKSILGIAASVMDLTSQTVQTALNSVKVLDVQKWIKENIGLSLQAQKQRAFSA